MSPPSTCTWARRSAWASLTSWSEGRGETQTQRLPTAVAMVARFLPSALATCGEPRTKQQHTCCHCVRGCRGSQNRTYVSSRDQHQRLLSSCLFRGGESHERLAPRVVAHVHLLVNHVDYAVQSISLRVGHTNTVWRRWGGEKTKNKVCSHRTGAPGWPQERHVPRART